MACESIVVTLQRDIFASGISIWHSCMNRGLELRRTPRANTIDGVAGENALNTLRAVSLNGVLHNGCSKEHCHLAT
jgi:hypothetical protein